MRVLMVCTGNICRSPMAEGLLQTRLPVDLRQRVQVASAGTHGLSGHRAEPLAVEAVAGYDTDISGHRARRIDREIIRKSDLILVMEHAHEREISLLVPAAAGRVHLLGAFATTGEHGEVPDPYGADFAVYRRTAALIHSLLPPLLAHLKGR